MPRILVVDDEPAVRGSVRRILEHAGHEVVEAEDGKAAIATLEAAGVDLVLTDIFMPGEDGIMTIRHIHKRWPGLPVIAMSGGSRAGDLTSAAVALGATRALSKPFTIPELLEAVKAVLPPPSRD